VEAAVFKKKVSRAASYKQKKTCESSSIEGKWKQQHQSK